MTGPRDMIRLLMSASEASKRGLSMGEMFKDVGILGGLVVCFLLALFFASVITPLITSKDASPEQKKTISQLCNP